MRMAVAIVCAALPLSEAACTLGPTDADGGADASTTPARALGDQCQDVISEFCQQGPRCALSVGLAQCVSNYLPLCCMGSKCTAASTIRESAVTSCKQTIDALDCNVIVNTSNPAICLSSP